MPRQSTENVIYKDRDPCDDAGDDNKVVIGFQSKVVVGDIKEDEDGASISFKGENMVTVVGHTVTTIVPHKPEDHYQIRRCEVQMGDVFEKKEGGKLYEDTGKRTAPPSELKPGQNTW